MKNHDYNSADYLTNNQTKLYLDLMGKIYCTYSHLAERFSELIGNEAFEDLDEVISELVIRSEKQLARLDLIYHLLGQNPCIRQYEGLTQFLEDNFSLIQTTQTAKTLRGSYLLFYLHYANSILMSAFQLLRISEASGVPQGQNHIDELILLAQSDNNILMFLA